MASTISRYGVTFETEAGIDPSFSIELRMAFDKRLFAAPGFLGRYQHLHNAIDIGWNEPRRIYATKRKMPYDPAKNDVFIFNDWTERMMSGFCENNEVIIAGPGASWKTTCGAMFFYLYWLASPSDTRVILTSTTGDGLRARVWKELVHFHRMVPFGNLVQSRTMIQFTKGDDGAGIFGIAVESDGDVDKAINKIIGRHNTNMGVFVDEMPTVNNAIVDACVNLETGAERFQFGGVGNPDSQLDPHGIMAEPEAGWDSISEETESWRTKRGGLGICLNGRTSPRIGNDDLYPGLIRQIDLDKTSERYGEDSPQFWKQRIGFWAPESVNRTVLSMAMINKGRARDVAIWVGDYTIIAALDPSWEGQDRCVLRFFHVGEVIEKVIALALKEVVIIKVKISSPEPLHYQICRMVKTECEQRNVPSRRFGLDTTGEGGGLASIMVREWGEVHMFEFGGLASTEPISETNPKPANKEYDRKVTELHFRFATSVTAGQIRELDVETANEFCQRRYEMKGNIISLETKKIMKSRLHRSPDLSDNAVIGHALARKLGLLGNALAATHSARSRDKWLEFARKMDMTAA